MGKNKLDTFHVHLSMEEVRDLIADKEAMEDVPANEEDQSPAEEDLREDLEREQRLAEEEQRRRHLERVQKENDQRKMEEDQRRAVELSQREEQSREEVRRERRKYEASSRGGHRSLNRSRSRSSTRSRSRSRSRDQLENSREKWQDLLSPGILKEMHEHGVASVGPLNILQLLGKEVRDGLVVSATMGDGKFVSSNIFPADKHVTKDMVSWPHYSMVKLEDVSIHKDRIIHNETSPTADKVSEQPLLAKGVKEFEFLNSQTLLL